MSHFIARPEHVERMLPRYGETLEELAAFLGEHDDTVFLDSEGRLCVREGERPSYFECEEITGGDLDQLLEHYGVSNRDLHLLRGRMIVETSWSPQDVVVDGDRLSCSGIRTSRRWIPRMRRGGTANSTMSSEPYVR